MAGYSQRTLLEKLGIKPNVNIHILNSPQGYRKTLGSFPKGVNNAFSDLDFIQFFAKDKKALETEFPRLTKLIKKNGTIWISWPKLSSKVATDLSENVIREIGLASGMVDVKVIAVDDTWSGLKFVYRLKDRRK